MTVVFVPRYSPPSKAVKNILLISFRFLCIRLQCLTNAGKGLNQQYGTPATSFITRSKILLSTKPPHKTIKLHIKHSQVPISTTLHCEPVAQLPSILASSLFYIQLLYTNLLLTHHEISLSIFFAFIRTSAFKHHKQNLDFGRESRRKLEWQMLYKEWTIAGTFFIFIQ